MVAEDTPAYTQISLKEAYESQTPVCARAGAAVANQLQRQYPGMNLVTAPDFVSTYERLRNNDCLITATRASDWSKYERDARVNTENCGLKWIGRAEAINGGGAATKIDIGEYCTSLVMHVLDIHFNEMHADGFIKEVWDKHVESLATNDCNADSTYEVEEEGGSLRPIDVGGIFVIHVLISVFAVFLAMLERRRRNYREKYGKKHDEIPDTEMERVAFRRGLTKGLSYSESKEQAVSLTERANYFEHFDVLKGAAIEETIPLEDLEEASTDVNYFHDDRLIEDAMTTLSRYLVQRRTGRSM